jgi:hypothetical protein
MKTPTMADRVEEYLAYRRALGYQLKIEGQMLQSFAAGPRRAADTLPGLWARAVGDHRRSHACTS